METDNLLEVMMAKLIYDDCRPNFISWDRGFWRLFISTNTYNLAYRKEDVYGIKLVSFIYFPWMLDTLVMLGIF